jgi:hypothetical protein
MVVVLIAIAVTAVGAGAQHEGHQMPVARPQQKAEPQPHPEKILGWEPIRCWRQTTAGAITIGQTFTMVLTCAIYEGDNAQVIPDVSRLDVASIQVAPFEIAGGSHPPDVHRGARRFFQYDYQLRIISPDAIGQDVNIPPLSISYRIHSRVGAAATLEGRDLSYLMPMMPIKVLSLVPNDASDIRDASEASLAAVDSLRFRSSAFRVLTLTFGALAIAMLVLALVPLARTRTTASGPERERAPDRAVLTHAAADLGEVQSRVSRDGWDDEAIARALGSARVVAAAAIAHPISQRPIASRAPAPEGRLLVRHGTIRRATVAVSSAVTADAIARARSGSGAGMSTTRQQQLEGLQFGIAALTSALYREQPARESATLDEAVRHAQTVAQAVAAERHWWKPWARR